jgi:hypothetical protein
VNRYHPDSTENCLISGRERVLGPSARDASGREAAVGDVLAITLKLSVTGLPAGGKDAAALGGPIAYHLAELKGQRAACARAFLVMVASRSGLGRADAVVRLTLLKTIVRTPR